MTGIKEIINDHLKFLFALSFGAALVLETTNSWPNIQLPEWTELGIQFVLIAAVCGYLAGGKVWDLLPEQHGIYLACIEGDDTDKLEIWELTEDQWEELTVKDGTLNELREAKHRAYECVSYDDQQNAATATWRKSKENSELIGQTDVTDALDEIAELRGSYEKEVRWGNAIRRRIPSIIRILDRQRAKDQNRALEGHLTPSLDGTTVEDVIQDSLGDLAPDHLGESNDEQDATGEVADDLIDDLGPLAGAGDGEAIEPEPASGDD
jgi:hypothetical protein